MKRLDRSDWINAGLAALSAGSRVDVRIELLAKKLNVSKGSFYWHFSAREDLLGAMIEVWERSQTSNVIATIEARGGDPYERFRNLSKALESLDFRLEAAIRGWAGSDANVRIAVERIDRQRLAYLQSIIESAGVPVIPAKARARLVYFSLVGAFTSGGESWMTDHRESMDLNRAMILDWPSD